MFITAEHIGKGLTGLLVIIILLLFPFYPYSIFDDQKSYSTNPDHISLDQYYNDLKEYMSSYEQVLDEPTTDETMESALNRTQFVIELIDQKLLVNKDPENIKIEVLDNILFEVRNTSMILIDLSTYGDYSRNQKQFLADSGQRLLLLEELINNIKQEKLQPLYVHQTD
ncbi:hypothetical protein [Tenuibacillus multivorans]|uniref:Uncharacterized protein n=1 Tax=Tenuibacillus multivorans TaxID=237069 RepID=A0A1H0EQY4_9BACI|nr:hypothetical protein [Tenuibacillus multivorans]GEL76994.1 hypothetical protein TMU01_12290 [Tenuibacillus multivorans]SDN84755.1 hypothetical protein SAMN05216498_0025 [Tenuibacillus multivorans]